MLLRKAVYTFIFNFLAQFQTPLRFSHTLKSIICKENQENAFQNEHCMKPSQYLTFIKTTATTEKLTLVNNE